MGGRALLAVGCLLAAALALLAAAARDGTANGAGAGAGSAATGGPRERARAAYGRLPLAFVPNAGQLDRRVRYSARAGDAGFFFTDQEAVFSFARSKHRSLALRLRFVGANRDVVVAGRRPQAGRVNYLRGDDPAQWRANVPTYGAVVYRELWPGIDLVFRGGRGKLKYELHVAPGASVDRVRLAYAGASGLSLDPRGNLRIRTSLGSIRDSRPVSYQELDGRRVPVASRFLLDRTGGAYGFAVASYDRSRPLVIDPGLAYSTFLGGSGIGYDYGYGVAVDTAGSAYVTGETASSDFPTSMGAYDGSVNGGIDAFVTKLNAAGSAIVYSTYLGGSSADYGNGIAVDGAGSAYVSGYSYSTNFPTTEGAFDESFNGDSNDAFITKLNAAGSGLDYSTYLGGTSNDAFSPFRNAIAVDGAGSAYVTGQTASADFPTSVGAYDTLHNGGYDAFVTKLNAAGSALGYSTYLGGGSGDYGYGIAVGDGGGAYITGETASTSFPTTLGAYDTTYNGNPVDAFVTRLFPSGALDYSTFLGGGFEDHGSGIAVDSVDSAYVTGYTASADFPTTAGVFDRIHDGEQDAFVTKLNAAGSALGYSTYLGGGDVDYGYAITADVAGTAFVTGATASAEDFPTTAGTFDTSFNGGVRDAFVTKVNAAGTLLVDSTYLGGEFGDFGYGIAIDDASSTYVTGQTSSTTTFPTTPGAFDGSFNGGPSDAFVTKLDAPAPPPPCAGGAPADFDGSGDTDVSVWRPEGGTWYAFGGLTQQWGVSDDVPVPGQYDGYPATDVAVWRPADGTWYVEGGATQQWGISSDVPVPGDYDGDCATEFAVWRPADGTWYVQGGATQQWGISTDIPVPGDYDGDGDDDFAVWRPSDGTWYVHGGATEQWGVSSDIPVPGQYDADRATEIAVWRPSSGTWYVFGGATQQWGISSDVPVPGDYDGDGDTEFAVWRPSEGTWYVFGGATQQWGIASDKPLPQPPAIARLLFP